MAYLLDTGILLRIVDAKDARHSVVMQAVQRLISQRESLLIATQNVAEFCNVVTRPVANNGLGLPPQKALELLAGEIEPIATVISEREQAYSEFKRLVLTYNVSSKQVHDARLVAMMLAWQVESILTLNDQDFRRYQPEGITVVTPSSLAASP